MSTVILKCSGGLYFGIRGLKATVITSDAQTHLKKKNDLDHGKDVVAGLLCDITSFVTSHTQVFFSPVIFSPKASWSRCCYSNPSFAQRKILKYL